MKKYYLCSEIVVDLNPNFIKSKPFKSGYSFDEKDNYYIIYISNEDFDNLNNLYNSLDETLNFWIRECVPGTMDVSKITLKDINKDGLMVTFENTLDSTQVNNIAMVIYNLSEKYNVTPIEFINKLLYEK